MRASATCPPPGPLPTGQFRSLQVTTPGYTSRYVRHSDSLGITEAVTSVDLAPQAEEINKQAPLFKCNGCASDIAKALGASA